MTSGPKFEIKPTTKKPSRLDFHVKYVAHTPKGWVMHCSCGFRARTADEDLIHQIFETHLQAIAQQMLS